MSTLICRTALSSSFIISRLQLNSPKLIVQQIKLQSTTTNNNDALNSTNKFNMVSFYSTDNKKESSNKEGGESLEKKLLGITSARAINPFNIYLKEKYKSTIESNPKATQKEVFAILGNSWRSLTFDEKLKYLETANENRRQKKADLEKFYSSISEEQASTLRKSLKTKRSERRKEMNEYRKKREKRNLKRPKHAPSAFILYTKTLDRGEAGIQDFIKGASMKWKALAVQDKQKFIDEAKALSEEYKKKLAEWETQMVSQGRVDLVRLKFRNSLENKLTKKKSDAQRKLTKGRQKLRLKKLRAQARQADRLRKKREKVAKAKEAAKKKLVKAEVAKTKKLVELASKLKLHVIKKSVDGVEKKAKRAAKKNKAKESSDESSDDENVKKQV